MTTDLLHGAYIIFLYYESNSINKLRLHAAFCWCVGVCGCALLLGNLTSYNFELLNVIYSYIKAEECKRCLQQRILNTQAVCTQSQLKVTPKTLGFKFLSVHEGQPLTKYGLLDWILNLSAVLGNLVLGRHWEVLAPPWNRFYQQRSGFKDYWNNSTPTRNGLLY